MFGLKHKEALQSVPKLDARRESHTTSLHTLVALSSQKHSAAWIRSHAWFKAGEH